MLFTPPQKVELRIKLGRNGRATNITYEIRKIFSVLFLPAENNALTCSIFYAVPRESLMLLYTLANSKFKELSNDV